VENRQPSYTNHQQTRFSTYFRDAHPNDDWLPHFTCHAVGEAIRSVMIERPDRKLTVLCGHTHGRGESRPLPNVLVYTGGAQYGRPEIQAILEFS
ncbi:MAG: hypothetical protein K2Y37_10010, partial [Pirellulales bacterium]|nr:hypothetical protein [Pirellulales bacterium]